MKKNNSAKRVSAPAARPPAPPPRAPVRALGSGARTWLTFRPRPLPPRPRAPPSLHPPRAPRGVRAAARGDNEKSNETPFIPARRVARLRAGVGGPAAIPRPPPARPRAPRSRTWSCLSGSRGRAAAGERVAQSADLPRSGERSPGAPESSLGVGVGWGWGSGHGKEGESGAEGGREGRKERRPPNRTFLLLPGGRGLRMEAIRPRRRRRSAGSGNSAGKGFSGRFGKTATWC